MSLALEILEEAVATPSLSGHEAALAERAAARLSLPGVQVERFGDNVVARVGEGPDLLWNTHLDTVPADPGWTRDPWTPTWEGDRLYGLGSNDAKASLAAMTAALIALAHEPPDCRVTLTLVCQEETGGKGTEAVWPWLQSQGYRPAGVVVGEPTGLDAAVWQRGLLVLELVADGDACHAANADRLGARNPIFALGEDLGRLRAKPLPEHAVLGRTTLQPTVIEGGDARNRVPGRASCVLDVRTVPGATHGELVAQIRENLVAEVKVLSERLVPFDADPDSAVVRAARLARPALQVFGSATMSDLVFFQGLAGIKCGPGDTTRSHTPDEYVLSAEVTEAARFYERLAREFAGVCQ
jgi:acetylornithine deacetylase